MPEKIDLTDSVAGLLSEALKLDGFFPEFTADQATKVFLRSGLFRYAKGERVIEQGEAGRDLFVLYCGKAEVVRNRNRVGVLKDRDVFGEMGMLGDGVRVATVMALEECQVFRLVFDDIQYLLKHNEALGKHLAELIDRRSER